MSELRQKYPKEVAPSGRRLLCRRVPEVTSSVLFVPDKYVGASLLYEVLACGPLCIWPELENNAGAGKFVFTGVHGSTPLPLYRNPDIYIINEEDVLAVVTDFQEGE